jgi:hypothetical protein
MTKCDQEDEREYYPALSACRRVRFCGCQHNVTLYRVCGRATLAKGTGMLKTAKLHGVGIGTVQRISRELAA